MRGLATLIMKGRGPAVLVIFTLTVLSWVVSLASLLATAAVALPTLRKGAWEGAIIMVVTLLAVALAGGILFGNPWQAGGYALALWGPIWLVAIVLRESGQLALALMGTTGLGLVLVLGLYLVYGNPAALWLEELRRFAQAFLVQGHSEAEVEWLWRTFTGLSRYMTGFIAAGSILTLSLSLLIARWWQAMLFNPGGFRTEFLHLRLPSIVAYSWLGLLGFAWIASDGGSEMAWNLAIPFFPLFLLLGFAVLHALLSNSGMGRFWLTGLYVALVFMSPLIGLVLLIGFSDIWINWRRKFLMA